MYYVSFVIFYVMDVASKAQSGSAHPHQSMSCATRLKCVASLVSTRSRQAAPGFVVGRLLLAAGSARVLAAGAGSRRLRVLGLRAICFFPSFFQFWAFSLKLKAGSSLARVACSRSVLMPFQWFPTTHCFLMLIRFCRYCG